MKRKENESFKDWAARYQRNTKLIVGMLQLATLVGVILIALGVI